MYFKFKKFFTIVLILVFIIALFCGITKNVYASNFYQEKIYCDVNIEESFDDDSVIVIMDKSLSEVNKVHSVEFFGSHLIKEVKDLTFRNSNFSTENFKQILKLTLHKKDKQNVIDVIKILEKKEGIKYVGPNRTFYMQESHSVDDSVHNGLWGLDTIEATTAWQTSTGNNHIYVGVIDSGIDSHPELVNNLVSGKNLVLNNSETGDDVTGHGTEIAGVIGAIGNNDIGFRGVNQNVSLVPLKITDSQGGIHADAIVSAIEYATASYATEHPIRILNLSYSTYSSCPEVETAIRDYPGLFVCCSGNELLNIDSSENYCYPAFYGSNYYSSPLTNMIVVGASNEYDSLYSKDNHNGSNYGENTVNIYAPGCNILTTYPLTLSQNISDEDTPYGYRICDGTSIATPFVSGVAALLLSINPNLTVNQLKSAILEGAETKCMSKPYGTLYAKRLNAANSVDYVLTNYPITEICINNDMQVQINVHDENHYIKLSFVNNGNYMFSITSLDTLTYTLFDSSFNKITTPSSNNNTLTYTSKFSYNFSGDIYYLKFNYTSMNDNTINLLIGHHSHSYTNSYIWLNRTKHSSFCECGTSTIQGHAVFVNSQNCVLCGGPVDKGFIVMSTNSNQITMRTKNGSYILPNGVIVLVYDDLIDYLNNTLFFYNVETLLEYS